MPETDVEPSCVVHSWSRIQEGLRAVRDRRFPFEVQVFRHARTTHNDAGLVTGSADVPLSDSGREEAKAMASLLPKRIDVLVTSGLSRTRETAELALSGRTDAARVLADARLNEECLGILEGLPRREVAGFAAGDVDHAVPDGESYRTAARRVASAVADLQGLVPDEGRPATVVMFAHAGVMRVLATLDGSDWTSARMFGLAANNGERLVLRSETFALPSFWTRGDPERLQD